MTYATQQDLIDRFGSPELVELTNRGEIATGEIDATMVTAALVEADAEINSYLRKQVPTPLDPVPDQVKRIGVDIARYRLYRDNAPDYVVRGYTDAIKWLTRAAAGDVSLGDATAPTAPASAGAVEFEAPRRVFTSRTLKGF